MIVVVFLLNARTEMPMKDLFFAWSQRITNNDKANALASKYIK